MTSGDLNSHKEEWRPVVGYEALYHVSDLGRIRSYHGRVAFLKPKALKYGYLSVNLCASSKKWTRCVHRIVGDAFLGQRPIGMVTRHLDGDTHNNRASNLRYGTQYENEADKIAHGTKLYGDGHPSAKLNSQQVATIRTSRLPARVLAKKFGVSRSAVAHARRGYSWKVERAA